MIYCQRFVFDSRIQIAYCYTPCEHTACVLYIHISDSVHTCLLYFLNNCYNFNYRFIIWINLPIGFFFTLNVFHRIQVKLAFLFILTTCIYAVCTYRTIRWYVIVDELTGTVFSALRPSKLSHSDSFAELARDKTVEGFVAVHICCYYML